MKAILRVLVCAVAMGICGTCVIQAQNALGSDSDGQSSLNQQGSASDSYIESMTPNERALYEGWKADPARFEAFKERNLKYALWQLTKMGYGKTTSSPDDSETRKSIANFQRKKGFPQTGSLDLLTYCAILNELDHLPTFRQLRASHSLPKWATTVCFEETRTHRGEDVAADTTQTKDEEASDFLVFGPKGTRTVLGPSGALGIRTTEYLMGKPLADANWERVKGGDNLGVFRSTPWQDKQHYHDWVYMDMEVNWSSNTYSLDVRSANTNQTLSTSSGHCSPIQ
jgi:hypothetical protein